MSPDEPFFILFYEYVDDMAARRAPHREAHLEHIRSAPHMFMAGALGDPPHGGALIFRGADPGEIERFVDADPYMRAGLITRWRIEPWRVV